jgi:hypothetical protein
LVLQQLQQPPLEVVAAVEAEVLVAAVAHQVEDQRVVELADQRLLAMTLALLLEKKAEPNLRSKLRSKIK